MSNDVEHLFLSLLAYGLFSFEKCLFKSIALISLFAWLSLRCNSSLCLKHVTYHRYNWEIFSLIFYFIVFTEVSKCDEVQFTFSFSFYCLWFFVSYIRNYCLIPSHWDLFLFSSKSFIILPLIFRFMIYIVYFYIWCDLQDVRSFACGCCVVWTLFIEKSVFFPLNCLGAFVKI